MPTAKAAQPATMAVAASGSSSVPQATQTIAAINENVASLPIQRTSSRTPRVATAATAMRTTRSRIKDRERRPEGEDVANDERDEAGGDRQTIRQGIEDLAELRNLVRPAGEPSIDPVRGDDHDEQDQPLRGRVRIDDQQHEDGDQQDACRRDEVRDREDAPGRGCPRFRFPLHPSGRPDSNRRPSDPQSDALTKLRHGPCRSIGTCDRGSPSAPSLRQVPRRPNRRGHRSGRQSLRAGRDRRGRNVSTIGTPSRPSSSRRRCSRYRR